MSNQHTRILDLMDELRARRAATSAPSPSCAPRTRPPPRPAPRRSSPTTARCTGSSAAAACRAPSERAALEALSAGEPRLIRVKPKEDVVEPVDVDGVELHKSSCPSGGTVDLFLEPMRQAMRLVICGASPVAAALVSLARVMGYRAIVGGSGAGTRRGSGRRSTTSTVSIWTRSASSRAMRWWWRPRARRDREALRRRTPVARGLCRHGRQPQEDRQAPRRARPRDPWPPTAPTQGPGGARLSAPSSRRKSRSRSSARSSAKVGLLSSQSVKATVPLSSPERLG